MTSTKIKPIVKWAGGKSKILNLIKLHIPNKIENYYEPFLGSAAVYFHIFNNWRFKKAYLNDSNVDLMNLYSEFKERPEKIANLTNMLPDQENMFLKVRNWDPKNNITKAVKTLYLNKTCFNGLFRVNGKGKFNVPYGHYNRDEIVDLNTVMSVSSALKNAKLLCTDWSYILKEPLKSNDFVFLDPPFMQLKKTSFKGYTSDKFDEHDHDKIAKFMKSTHAKCMLCNSGVAYNLFHSYNFRIEKLKAPRSIHGGSKFRESADDLFVFNY